MNILLTNDDGIYAEGLWALYKRFTEKHSVTVVAPDRKRSAVGHGITLHKPLYTSRVVVSGGGQGYAVSGTPTDCIKLSILTILDARPDMVISGINPGANVGVNINYSGTVAAAKEAALYGIAAIAVSIDGDSPCNYDDAAIFTTRLAEKVRKKRLPFGTILNVNIPDIAADRISGVRVSRQELAFSAEYFEKRTDPRNRTYYWQGCDSQTSFNDSDSDVAALCQNFISITPVKCDATDYDTMEDLKGWEV